MSSEPERRRPSALPYLAYCYGRVLPASRRDWVRSHLARKGAAGRRTIHTIIPAFR